MVWSRLPLRHHFKIERMREHGRRVQESSLLRKAVDKTIYPIGMAGPLLTFHQAGKIWILREAAGVSKVAWSGYVFIALFWFFYGVVYKNKPIMVINFLAMIGYIIIVVGAFVYG